MTRMTREKKKKDMVESDNSEEENRVEAKDVDDNEAENKTLNLRIYKRGIYLLKHGRGYRLLQGSYN